MARYNAFGQRLRNDAPELPGDVIVADEEEDDDYPPMPCGCREYHMADCHLMTGEDMYDGEYEYDDDPYWEDE